MLLDDQSIVALYFKESSYYLQWISGETTTEDLVFSEESHILPFRYAGITNDNIISFLLCDCSPLPSYIAFLQVLTLKA